MIIPTIVRRFARTASLLAPLAAILAGPARAQSGDGDPRWQAWLGCWEPAQVLAPEAEAAAGSSMLCVIPASGTAAVEIATVENGVIAARERVAATGEQRPHVREGCAGWERVEWSEDGRRVYRRSEHDCGGGLQRRSTGLLSILPTGEWLHVQGVSAGGNTDVRVVRHRPVRDPERIPAEVSRALEGRALALQTARTAAAARLAPGDVVEAVRHLDPEVIEAWLIEREQGFMIDAGQLVRLADAGVPERVIDLMVALSYPRVFTVNRATGEGERRPEEQARPPRRTGPVSIWDTGYYPGYGYYPRYGRGYGWYGGPAIVVRDSDDRKGSGARAVKGRGYTRNRSGGSADSSPAPRPSSSPAGASSGSGDSGSSSGSTRKAKPRSGGD